MAQAMKSGIGTYTVELPGGVLVAALAAVNALGDVRDPATGKIVAGARRTAAGRDFLDSNERMMRGGVPGTAGRGNTTLVVAATNARLNKVQTRKMAELASLGVARAIYPVNTMFDGDTTFALSMGTKTADVNAVGVGAAEAVAQAILRAVRMARTLGGVPGLG